MAAEVVGTAYVRIRALTTKLAGDIKDAVNKGAAEADADVGKSGSRLGTKFGDSFGDSVKESVKKNVTDAMADGVGDAVGDGLRRGLTDSDDESKKFGSGLAKSILGQFFTDVSTGLASSKGTNVFSKALKGLSSIKFTGLSFLATLIVPVLIGVLKTATYYVVGLVAQLGFLATAAVGAGGALAGAFLGVAPALILLMTTLKAETPTLERFTEDMKKFKGPWLEVAEAVQKKVFPAVYRLFQFLTWDLRPLIRDYAEDIGTITASFIDWISAVLGTERSLEAIRTILDRGRSIWRGFLGIVLSITEAVLPLGAILTKLGEQLIDTFGRIAQRWKDMIIEGSDSGALEATLQKWYDRAEIVFGGIADLAVGLWNVLKVGAEAAGPSFDTFKQFAQDFRWWSASLEGQSKLKTFFETALEVMKEVNLLLKDIISLIFTPILEGNNTNIVAALQGLRTEVLPAVVDLVRSITANIDGKVLTDFMLSFTTLVQALESSGVLATALPLMTKALQAFAAVLNTPIVGDLLGTFLGVVWGLSALMKLPGVATILGWIGDGLWALASPVLVAGLNALWTALANLIVPAEAVTSAFGGAGAAAGGGLAGALGIVAVAVAAVLAIYTSAYFLFDQSRAVIDNLWTSLQNLKDAFGDLFVGEEPLSTRIQNFILAGMEATANLITLPFEMAVSILQGIWDRLALVVENGGENLGSLVETIENKLGEIFGGIPEKLGGAVDVVEEKLGEIGGAISSWVTGLPGQITGFFSAAGGATGGASQALLSWIDNAGSLVAEKLGYFTGRLIAWLALLPGRIWEQMWAAGEALVGWVTEAVPRLGENVGIWVAELWTRIQNFIIELPNRLVAAKDGFVNWISESIPRLQENLGTWKDNVFNWIGTFASELPEKMGAIVESFEEGIGKIASGLWDGVTVTAGWLGGIALSFWSWITAFVGAIPEKLGAMVEAFENLGADLFQGLLDGLISAAGLVTGWMGDFFSGLFQGAKDEVESNSPSKKFMRLGQDMMLGLAIGLSKSGDKVGQTLSDVLSKQLEAGEFTPQVSIGQRGVGVGAFGQNRPGAAAQNVTFQVDVTASGNMTDEEAQRLGANIAVGAQKQWSRNDLVATIGMA